MGKTDIEPRSEAQFVTHFLPKFNRRKLPRQLVRPHQVHRIFAEIPFPLKDKAPDAAALAEKHPLKVNDN
jgi:hypothetical protein